MALSQTLRAPSSPRTAELNGWITRAIPGLAWTIFLTLAISGPWLEGGYIFGTDWSGPRRFDWPNSLAALAPVDGLLWLLARVIPSDLIGKLFIISAILAGAILAHRSIPTSKFAGRAAGSALFVFNPFVFGRIHYGQLALIAGYALLPWAAVRAREMCREPSWMRGAVLGLSLALVAMFTLHLFLVGWFLALVSVAVYLASRRPITTYARRMAAALAGAFVASVVLNGYWLLPLFAGKGYDAQAIAGTGAGALRAYAAVPDQSLGLIPNLIGLYGFWAEDTNRFTSMKAFVPGWQLVLVPLLMVAAFGAWSELRRRVGELRPWVAALVIAAGIAVILEMGVSSPLTSGLVTWLDRTLPLYRGMRDAAKWAALLGLVYSQLFGLGTAAVLAQLGGLKPKVSPQNWIVPVATGLLIALPIYYGNGLLFGMHGEIRPSAYPAGWYAADRVLLADPHPERAVFLPWHEYMSYSFIQNQNKVVASPAPSFFSIPVLSSANPEVAGVAPPGDPDQLAVSQLVGQGASGNWATVLASLRVKYVLLAREVDWQSYAYLARMPGLTRVGDFGSIVVYRVSN